MNCPVWSDYRAAAIALLDYDEEAEIYFRRAVANGSDGKKLRAYIDNLRA
ncbi:MAG: hypothetical protein J6C98_02515 [Oscillospiraceae bacterium]|nr:hypothetical protein [Oscillospiraceae bacterium]